MHNENIANIRNKLVSFREFISLENKNSVFIMYDVIKSILTLLKPFTDENNIEVECNISKKMQKLQIYGNPNDMKQVFMNIILNSKDAIIKNRKKGKIDTGKIVITFETENNYIIIKIMDNGAGLTKDSKQKIFDLYYTTKENSGTGMGMFTSYMMIQKMDGELTAGNNKKYHGASIQIKIPLYKE